MIKKLYTTAPKYKTAHPLERPIPSIMSQQTPETVSAVVVDVIVDEDHPEYAMDGYNVGCIQFREIEGDYFRPAGKLNWAFPYEANISEYPLKNEIVEIRKILNRFYYLRKLNVGKNSSNQAMFGLEPEMHTLKSPQQKTKRLQQSTAIPDNVTAPDEGQSLGKYFQEYSIPKLKHWEGDIIYEGRTGQSIRLGSSWKDPRIHKNVFQSLDQDHAPTILLRAGAWENAPRTPNGEYGRITEDIDKDKTSLWMVTDQIIKLTPATESTPVHKKSIVEYPSKFSGNQLAINSGRILLNAKEEEIFAFSKKGIHITTGRDTTIDANRDFYSLIGRDSKIEILGKRITVLDGDSTFWGGSSRIEDIKSKYAITAGDSISMHSQKNVSIIAPKIYLGTESGESEPLVLGESLRKILIRILQAHVKAAATHVTTSMGPGVLNGGIVAEFNKIISELNRKTILSDANFTTKKNNKARVPRTRITLH